MNGSAHLPAEFLKLMEASIGKEASGIFMERYAASSAGVTSIRTNPLKIRGNWQDVLPFAKDSDDVKWCSNGYYLSERPLFTLDPLFHAGAYYVQEASSMFAEVALKAIAANSESILQQNRLKVLDLCAAPGGKSTHIASLISKDSLLVSNEVIRSRSVILADNMAKWGSESVVVTNNDPRDFTKLSGYFDIVFVDAPCSGEGMFIKEPQSIDEWSIANVGLCASRQKRILQDIWQSVAPGGYLVYSTCTFNHFENDDNLRFLIDEFGADVISADEILGPLSGDKILKSANGGYQFVPGLVEGEGQFFAIVKKESGVHYSEVKERKSFKEKKGVKKGGAEIKNALKNFTYLSSDEYDFTLIGEIVKAYPKNLASDIKIVEENLKILSSGIAVATLKGRDYIPHPDFALQRVMIDMVAMNRLPAGISAVEVSRDIALKFLAKEPLVFADAPTGYLLLTYKGLGLGFVKNLGNRCNNLLPMARRIRMSITK